MNTGIENHTFLKETDFFNRNMDMHTHIASTVIVQELWVLSIAITSIFHYLKIVYGCDRFEDKGITFYLENHFFSFIFHTFAK